MPGKILILDSVPTNRIVLKVKLSAAFYQVVQANTLKDAQLLIRRGLPDLILIGTAAAGDDDGLAACKALKKAAPSAGIPLLMMSDDSSRAFRKQALEAGADHVFAKPVDESALLARIRALLRLREGEEDVALPHRTSQALGFAEAQAGFDGPAQVLFATPDSRTALTWRNRLKPLVPYHMAHKPVSEALRGIGRLSSPDSFVIALDEKAPEDGLRLLAEIRARAATRHSGVLIILPPGCDRAEVDALDLGASDVMEDGFDAEEMALRLATIIKRKRFRDGLRQNLRDGLEAAVTDPLTGLYNRRYALPHLERLAEFSAHGNRNFAVMVADLDHFKAINDRYGHAAGDAVLVNVAHRLRDGLRPVDLLARIGGEEFLIVLPATSRAVASAKAAELCRLIGETPVTLKKKDLCIPVTVSIGVAMARDHLNAVDASGAALLEEADQALYRAKSTGRNQVLLTGPGNAGGSAAAARQ
ncbi:diguanylate cyclase [Shimia sediminis]|uniref:diguanylate cyclase n=1 Tax=Shimia sediminis TaxID=2497945 RepID=UPI0013DF2513|nr:diguanylate cyclase [Shimia sediminis]